MLEGLGATVREVSEPFQPLRGAYSGHGHAHGHDHGHDHGHGHHHDDGHQHGERDRFGRLPGDPHYGHNHA
jgi:urease accessory protein